MSLFADLDLEDIIGDYDYPIKDVENFNPDATLFSLPFAVTTFAAYGIGGDESLDDLESALRTRAAKAKGGKFNKTDVLYSPIAPPPGAWDYRCRKCRFFEPGQSHSFGLCEIVGHDEDPFGGERINSDAWCAMWMPQSGTPYLSYIKNKLESEDI